MKTSWTDPQYEGIIAGQNYLPVKTQHIPPEVMNLQLFIAA